MDLVGCDWRTEQRGFVVLLCSHRAQYVSHRSQGRQGAIRFKPVYIVILLALTIPNILLGLYFSGLVNLAQASVGMFGIRIP